MHVLVEVPLGDADLLIDQLWAGGAVGVEERDRSVVGAFDDPKRAAAVAHQLGGTTHPVADDTGLDAWRTHAERVAVGPFTIRPPWLDPGDGIDLVIDPAHTFGSGSHPSTRLALGLLAERVEAGVHVLDLGAGSGVLSIAAALLGARATAIDVEPTAPTTIDANAVLNGVGGHVTAIHADLTVPGEAPAPADLTVCNVTIDIHELVGPLTAAWPTGPMIVAGILAGDQEARCAAAHRRTIVDRAEDGEWAALVLDRGPANAAS